MVGLVRERVKDPMVRVHWTKIMRRRSCKSLESVGGDDRAI